MIAKANTNWTLYEGAARVRDMNHTALTTARAEIARLRVALVDLVPLLQNFAERHPRWQDAGIWQDPFGVHQALTDIAALAPPGPGGEA